MLNHRVDLGHAVLVFFQTNIYPKMIKNEQLKLRNMEK